MLFAISFLRRGVKKNYEIDKKEIGKGQFATVRRGTHRKTNQAMTLFHLLRDGKTIYCLLVHQVYAVKTIYKDRLKKGMVHPLALIEIEAFTPT